MTNYTKKSVDGPVGKHFLDMLVLGGPFVGIAIALVNEKIPQQYMVVSVIAACVCLLILFVRIELRHRYLKCPTCKTKLPVDELPIKGPITFTCYDCKTTWDSGFIHSPD